MRVNSLLKLYSFIRNYMLMNRDSYNELVIYDYIPTIGVPG